MAAGEVQRGRVEEAKKYNEAQRAKYEKSAFGGVDIWFILGLAVFVVPFGGLAIGMATGAIHTG